MASKAEAATTAIQQAVTEARHEHGAEAVLAQLARAQREVDTLAQMADEPATDPTPAIARDTCPTCGEDGALIRHWNAGTCAPLHARIPGWRAARLRDQGEKA